MSCAEGYVSPFVNIVGKTIQLYVKDIPLDYEDYAVYHALLNELPPRPDCGVTVRRWSDFYTGEWVGYMVGLRDPFVVPSVEVLVPYTGFKMEGVPWEKLNPRG